MAFTGLHITPLILGSSISDTTTFKNTNVPCAFTTRTIIMEANKGAYCMHDVDFTQVHQRLTLISHWYTKPLSAFIGVSSKKTIM